MNVYKPHSITFPTTPSATHLWQINSWTPSPGFTEFAEFSASGPTPLTLGTHHRSPSAEFTTPDLDRILTQLDATYKIFAAYTSPVILGWLKKVNLGINEGVGSGVHQTLSMARALMSFTSLSAPQDQLAAITCNLQAIAAANGSAAVTIASNATLPAPSACSVYGLGPVQINTAPICVDGLTLNNNLTQDTRRCSNSIDPTYTAIDRIEPTLVIDTQEIDDVMAFFASPAAVTSVSFFLRKKLANGINVADATAEHIRFAATAGSAAQTGENQITIRLNNSMAVTQGIAIT
jgi:hypothetical protein